MELRPGRATMSSRTLTPLVSHRQIGGSVVTASVLPFQLLIAALGGWRQREQTDVIAFLREENRL